jgi:putative addiction module component (TIGR02574 family)
MNKTLLKELLQLSPAERLQLVEDLWDSIEPGDLAPLTDEQKREIERRYEDHVRNPARSSKWQNVKARLLARYE